MNYATLARIASCLIIPLAFVVLAAIPLETLERGPSLCIYRNLFGFPCLGCGMTRAFCALLHGRPLDAWRFNPLVAVAFPFFLRRAAGNLNTAADILFPGLFPALFPATRRRHALRWLNPL
jgi:hypothetical protein